MEEIIWYMGDNGQPTHQYLKESIQTLVEPYPKTLWRIVAATGKISHGYLPEMVDNLVEPLPLSLWRIEAGINNGAPLHKYLPEKVLIENNIYGYYNGRQIYRIYYNGKVVTNIYFK